ncbi:3-hydroxybutyryl-CoA epimerase [Sphingobium chlorophenolicum L-1]|uniref:3-hydroxybutyryl-CoA epimerase n=1 Tax=Sphingobium chlorophenolicum L-1 TaxID=690566 RepID=F6EW90_SPHCR|nr:3-hydroxyacyl-CoA dehydrogenase NAD-binding domain-containing protein [Sphingobium chlorophenolicum]AEG49784.1 3-hydroxybutyryl-CoA epimerase [Sphingobium chlorophenolicum L-1]
MIETVLHADVLEIVLNSPPVNALGGALRRDLAVALRVASADDAVRAIVIRGAGKLFCGGADITEFGQVRAKPLLPDLINEIESSVKPVVAAVHGSALGGGLEVALGCHYRIAAATAKLGLPEVSLGLLPGAGGTQRLPRLVGVEAALDMIVLGAPISAMRAAEIGLVDEVVDDEVDLAGSAIAFARNVGAVRRTRDLPMDAEEQLFEKFAARHARKIDTLDAPKACIAAIRAATELPFGEGVAHERSLFAELVEGAQSKALCHAFFAERAAAKIDNLPADIALRPVRRVGVIGAGTMGGGIAMNFLSTGIAVTIVETEQAALDRGVGVIRANYGASVARGRLKAEQAEAAMSLLTPTLVFEDLADCDLVIEAVYENMEVKKQIFCRLDQVARPGAMLASNTSYLDIDEIASVTGRPQDVFGLHFFSPANVMKLVEVVRGAQTSLDIVATAMALARKVGKVPVVARVCHGFIGNRMMHPRKVEAFKLLEEGATPAQIDRVHLNFGMPMGPFQMMDLAGCDIGWHRDPERVTTILEALCAEGRWGQKTGGGFYDYDTERKASPSPVAQAIIADFRERAGIVSREISDEEITVRTIYTIVNEGAAVLEGGYAQRSSDIDAVGLYGYGWPRHTGGPMFWAEHVGFDTIVAGLEKYSEELGPDFQISPLIRHAGSSKTSLDRAKAGDGACKS